MQKHTGIKKKINMHEPEKNIGLNYIIRSPIMCALHEILSE
jgi:hypothetical protein